MPLVAFIGPQAAPEGSQNIIASAQCILDRENYFVREVDRYLKHNDFLNLRKKEILYKKWLEGVSEPLLQKIEDKMESQSSEEIRKRKEQQHSLYLNYCKKKGYVALEDYDPTEYDPLFMTARTDCWKVSIPTLWDPLLEVIQRKHIETGIVKQCETGRPCSARELKELCKAELPLLPLSRQRLDAVEWLKIPHAYIASEVHKPKRQKVIIHPKESKNQRCPGACSQLQPQAQPPEGTTSKIPHFLCQSSVLPASLPLLCTAALGQSLKVGRSLCLLKQLHTPPA
ncbi:protein FAM228B [Colius striatus]|uniref:protein FAM228B n=1 Tax=Colius striatus TaxID=57412 RepID=UPI002B1DC0EB|nr:protein FAM228B [Colius striatus]